MNRFEVIKKPLITEKGTAAQASANQYYFAVDPRATKHDITQAVASIFGVSVVGVRTMNVGGKLKRVGKSTGRTSDWKKAIVTLKDGQRIEFLEGA